MKRLINYSFGATSAIVTSMGLIVGLTSINSTKNSIIAGLLVIAIADNIADTFSIHIFQESSSDSVPAKNATMINYITRFILSLSFVLLVAPLSLTVAKIITIIWGLGLLSLLSYFIAKAKKDRLIPEIAKHLLLAGLVIFVSQGLGYFIKIYFR